MAQGEGEEEHDLLANLRLKKEKNISKYPEYSLFLSGYLNKEKRHFFSIFHFPKAFYNLVFRFFKSFKETHEGKKYVIHIGIGIIVSGVVFCNFITARAEDEGSILFSLASDEEELIVERGVPPENGNESAINVLKPIISEEPKSGDNQENLMTVNESTLVKPENVLPSEERPQEEKSADETKKAEKKEKTYYMVQNGDTASSIAAKFGITTETLLSVNNLSESSLIKPGDKLVVLPTSGIVHKVKSGETVSELATEYKVEIKDIISYNNLGENGALRIGEELIIPGAKETEAEEQKEPEEKPIPVPEEKPKPVVATGKLAWPTTTRRISQYFRWGHRALDIPNKYEAILAADSGIIESAGWNGGYGQMILINHGNGMKTLYGHASKIYVKTGQRVLKGEKIGQVGSTGRSTGPHVHFEIMINGAKKNPLAYY